MRKNSILTDVVIACCKADHHMDNLNFGAAARAALGIDPQGKRLMRMEFPREDGPKRATMLVNTLDAVEEVSRDFTFTLELLSDDATIPLKAVMGKMVTISLVRDDGTLRYFNGYVFEFQFIKTDGGFAFYHMVLKPWLAYLRLRQDNAVFQNLTVLELCDKTFQPYTERDVQYRIAGEYPPLTLAVQYNETDHNHLHRRLEDSGLFYWYEHRADGHTLWLSDDSTRAEQIDGEAPEMAFQSAVGSLEDDGVHQWSAMRRVAAGRITLGSFDFKNIQFAGASFPSVKKHGGESSLEIYESTGAYGFNHKSGNKLACLRTEELEARDLDFAAQSNDRTAQPGRWFKLAGHFSGGLRRRVAGAAESPDDRSTRPYLVLSVHHRARNNYQDGRDALSDYENDFRCMRKTVPWRPARGWNSEPTRIFGVQTATVVGPPGEEIHTDEYGRVRLQFHWDRNGQFDAASSPWVRVVSGWAGANFGQISLPRIEQEVVVQFLDGNCDRPLVIGSVYNSRNMPPWDLPASKTQSGILTRSTVGAGPANANALRFEDKKGAEEVWLHAERNQRIEVENDESYWVGHDRSKTIDRDETVEIKHDQKITVHNDRTERVDREERIDIGGSRTKSVAKNEKDSIGKNWSVKVSSMKTETVGMAYMQNVGMGRIENVGMGYDLNIGLIMATIVGTSQFTKVGNTVSISAGDKIQFICGQSKVVLTPTAIYLESSDVHIKSGSKVHIDAPGDVLLNTGGAQSAPLGAQGKEK
jgi:type VI secretion system secreted protein VgrG